MGEAEFIMAIEEFRGLQLIWAEGLDPEDICQRCRVPWMVHGSPLYGRCPDGSRLRRVAEATEGGEGHE